MGKKLSRDKKEGLPREAFSLISVVLLLIVCLPILLPVALLFGTYHLIKSIRLGFLVKKHWYPQGKFLLFVYSDSPNWKEYIEGNILPKITDRAVVMNWSDRARMNWNQKPLELRIFLNWTRVSRFKDRKKFKFSGEEYNPVAIIFIKWWRPKVLKFWQPLKDFKHGKEKPLKEIEKELFEALEKPV
jgi:hypothetical protein